MSAAGWLARAFGPPAAAPPLPAGEVDGAYRRWRTRTLATAFIGYAVLYLCRKNISIALPALSRDLGYSNTELGFLGTLLYVTYGAGKLTNGVLGDHANARALMAAALAGSALVNLGFAGSSVLWIFGVLWAINGWVQSAGFPPCARLIAHWFSVGERGLKWSLWNPSHQVGAAAIAVMGGFLIQGFGWRAAFAVPAVICLGGALFVWTFLRDTPASVGLPPIARYRNDPELERDGREVTDEPESIRAVLIGRVLKDPRIWLISLITLFVYVVRTGTFDWAAKFLVEKKGNTIAGAGAISATFEVAGIAGAILAGVWSDRLDRGRRGPVCLAFMALTAAGVWLFWLVPAGHPLLDGACLALIGFAVYGPQFLLSVFATDLASRKAAATAVGLTGMFGYAGSALSSIGTGWLVDRYGWSAAFAFWGGAALVGALVAVPLWNAGRRRAAPA